jgi:hypothetical protein
VQENGPGTKGGSSWTPEWLKFDNSYFKVSNVSGQAQGWHGQAGPLQCQGLEHHSVLCIEHPSCISLCCIPPQHKDVMSWCPAQILQAAPLDDSERCPASIKVCSRLGLRSSEWRRLLWLQEVKARTDPELVVLSTDGVLFQDEKFRVSRPPPMLWLSMPEVGPLLL